MDELAAIPDVVELPAILDTAEMLAILDTAEQPAVFDAAERPAIPDIAELTDIADIIEPPAIPDATETTSIPDETKPSLIHDNSDPFEFNELTYDSQEAGDKEAALAVADALDDFNRLPDNPEGTFSEEEEEENTTSGSKQSSIYDWTGLEHDTNSFARVQSDTPPILDAIKVPSMFSEDATDSGFISEPNQSSDDSGLLRPALPSKTTEEEAVFTPPEEPPAIDEVSTSFVPAPLAATPASVEPSSNPEMVQEDLSIFPKVKAQSLQKQQSPGFFLSEDETMEVPLAGPPAAPNIKTLTTVAICNLHQFSVPTTS